MVLIRRQRPALERIPWQPSPLHSDLPGDLTLLLNLLFFFLTLKYPVIFQALKRYWLSARRHSFRPCPCGASITAPATQSTGLGSS